MSPPDAAPPPGGTPDGDHTAPSHQQYTKSPTNPRHRTAVRSRGAEFLAQHQRRHEAALRLPPVGPCGCIRDPLFDKHRCVDVLTDHQLDGWVAAIAHLDDQGTPAIVPAYVLAALKGRAAA
jgi:hypothetical protein